MSSRKTTQKRRPKVYKNPENKAKCDGNLISLADRTPEERHEIAMKAVEARRKKAEYKRNMQKMMKTLLTLPTNSTKKKQILKDFGFEDDEQTNATLLMVALFQKGLTGDMSAIRDIIKMADEFDLEATNPMQTSNGITINIVPTGGEYTPTEEDRKKLWDLENNMNWTDEDEEEWGTDEVYNPDTDK